MSDFKPRNHSSSGSLIEPYMMGFTKPKRHRGLTQKEKFGNHCYLRFEEIAANIKARMDNGGKTTGIELTNINELRE